MAGIFGANGTGKSAIVEALDFALTAIRCSATSWQELAAMPYAPFRLDTKSAKAGSRYELDFVLSGVRHRYGFEIDAHGVKREWLRSVPSSRWRTLLELDREEKLLRPSIQVNERELALSRALQLPQSPFHEVAVGLAYGCDVMLAHHAHREACLGTFTDMLAEGSMSCADVQALLEVADIGVTEVEVGKTPLSEAISSSVNKASDPAAETRKPRKAPGSGAVDRWRNAPEPLEEGSAGHLLFWHRGVDGESVPFSIHDESDGTLAWLELAVPALQALRAGSLLIVDGIDADLHPHLLELVLRAFTDDNQNIHGAQIIFSSHESYLLSPLSDVAFEPEQIWFTDKTFEGITELTNLSEFPRHRDANIAKRYLIGRYGGTPRLAPSLFETLISESGAGEE